MDINNIDMNMEKDVLKLKKGEIFLVIFYIILSELMIIFGEVFYGLGIYTFSLLVITLIIIFRPLDIKIKNILLGLALFIIFRMIIFSIPPFFDNIILQYVMISGVMLIPLLMSMEIFDEYRHAKKLPLVLISIGMVLSIVEYFLGFASGYARIGGEFIAISLIISFIVTLLIYDTKYLNKYISDTLSIISNPLLVTFIIIAISRIMAA